MFIRWITDFDLSSHPSLQVKRLRTSPSQHLLSQSCKYHFPTTLRYSNSVLPGSHSTLSCRPCAYSFLISLGLSFFPTVQGASHPKSHQGHRENSRQAVRKEKNQSQENFIVLQNLGKNFRWKFFFFFTNCDLFHIKNTISGISKLLKL